MPQEYASVGMNAEEWLLHTSMLYADISKLQIPVSRLMVLFIEQARGWNVFRDFSMYLRKAMHHTANQRKVPMRRRVVVKRAVNDFRSLFPTNRRRGNQRHPRAFKKVWRPERSFASLPRSPGR